MPLYLVDLIAHNIVTQSDDETEAHDIAIMKMRDCERQLEYHGASVCPAEPGMTEGEVDYTVDFDGRDGDDFTWLGIRRSVVLAGSAEGAQFAALQQVGQSRLARLGPATNGHPTAIKPKRKVEEVASENRQEQARALYEARNWNDLWRFKRTCKKTWRQLGFSFGEEDTIKTYKPNWI